MERMSANGLFFHRNCFKCSHCNCKLKMGNYSLSKGEGGEKGKFFCSVHYRQLFMSNPEAINYSRADAPKRQQSKTDLPAEKEKSIQQRNDESKQVLVEDTVQRTEQVHISIEDMTAQSRELPENKAEMLSGDEAREQNGDHPNERELQSVELEFNSTYLEKEVVTSEEEMVIELQTTAEAYGDLSEEDEAGIANGDDSEKVTNAVNVNVKLDQAPQQGTAEQLASITDVSTENDHTLHHQSEDDESEKVPATVTFDEQVMPFGEPEQLAYKTDAITENTCTLHQNADDSEKLTKTIFTTLDQEIAPQELGELTNKTDVTTEKPQTSCTPRHQNDDKSEEVVPREGELTNKTDVITEKPCTSSTLFHQESDKVTKTVTIDHEITPQNGEPEQLTCKNHTPTQEKRVMLIV